MSQTATREERQSALDQFASIKTEGPGTELATTVSFAPPADYIHGAQLVPGKPRDEMRVLQRIKVLAAAAGEGWYYRFPVKDNKTGRTSWIEGPSIKLANAVALIYGNCEIDCRAVDLGSAIMFHARFFDVESGFAMTRPFQQRKGVSKLGGSDEGRRDDATFQIGVSKAARNVVVNSLQTYCDFAFEEAKDAIVDKIGKDVEKWRGKIVERFGAKVDLRRVEAVIGRTSDKWLAPDIARIIAMGKSVEDGMATMDETFPALSLSTDLDGGNDASAKTLDQFAETAGGPSAASGAGTAAGRDVAHPAPVAVDRLSITNHLLGIGSAVGVELDERLERLDHAMRELVDEHPALEAFVKEAAQAAAKVARKDMTLDVARKWLEEQT
jgi:hypothetical protein